MNTENYIEIPLHVLEDLEVIRKSGKYNMMSGDSVLHEMHNRGDMGKTVIWLVKERGDHFILDYEKYVSALFELGNLKGLATELSE